jgi:SnoaL-like domain
VEQPLSPEIAKLVVKDRLHELEMAYCRGIDRRDPDLIKSVFFEDAIEDHGDAWYGTGHQWVDYIFSFYLTEFELTAHYVLNEWYKVNGNRAEGETHRISYHRRADGAELTAASRTFNRYECRHGLWRIAYRGVSRDWIKEGVVALGGSQARHLNLRSSVSGPSDISYMELSLFPRGPIETS